MLINLAVLCSLIVVAKSLQPDTCSRHYAAAGLSAAWNETIAHAMHSMTVQRLRSFNPEVTKSNRIPTVDRSVNVFPWKLLPHAPDMPMEEDSFSTPEMNVIDHLLSHMDKGHDGLGVYTSGVERIVHEFHMRDLYNRVLKVYQMLPTPDAGLCECLTDTATNGIEDAMRVYKFVIFEKGIHTGTFPHLVDAASWAEGKTVWAPWYEQSALNDVAVYLKCSLRDVSPKDVCKQLYATAGLSDSWNETIAHAMHSMTVQRLQAFNPAAIEANSIPTVDRSVNVFPWKLLPYAPDMPMEENSFSTPEMNVIDNLLSNMDRGHDGLGVYTSGVERIVHEFHMRDLYNRVLKIYQTLPMPDAGLCECLTSTATNGIEDAMRLYKFVIFEKGIHTGTFPHLVDAASWAEGKTVWAPWYKQSALYDVAVYLKCAAGAPPKMIKGRRSAGEGRTLTEDIQV